MAGEGEWAWKDHPATKKKTNTDDAEDRLPPPPSLPTVSYRPPQASFMGGAWRAPARRSITSVAGEASLGGVGTHRGPLLARPASDSRLPTAARSRPDSGRGADEIWKKLSYLNKRDHVANMLNQPLPQPCGAFMDAVPNGPYLWREGSYPKVPIHIAAPKPTAAAKHCADSDYEASIRQQRTNDQWNGFPRDFHTEYGEARIKQAQLMRK